MTTTATISPSLALLKALCPEPQGGWLHSWKLSNKKSVWYSDADLSQMASEAIRLSEAGEQVYFGVCATAERGGEYERAKIETVKFVPALYCDVDAGDHLDSKGREGKNLPTSDEALRVIFEMPLPPSIVLHSGGGFYPFWLLKYPHQITDEADRQRVAGLMRAWESLLRRKLGGAKLDSTAEPARVLRLPGTKNWKYTPPRVVEFVEPKDPASLDSVPRYLLDDFEQALSTADDFMSAPSSNGDHKSTATPQAAVNDNGNGRHVDTAGETALVFNINAAPPQLAFDAIFANAERFKPTWERRRHDFKDDSPSGYCGSLAMQALGFGWSDQQVTDLIIAWQRKHGELTRKPRETMRKIRKTLKTAKRKIQAREAEQKERDHREEATAPVNDVPPQDDHIPPQDHKNDIKSTPAVQYQRLTCRELDTNEYSTEFLIQPILVAGQPCIVAGGKKVLKTSILIALALALATCRDFLAHFRVMRAARVALMTGESGLSTIQETARRIALSMGLTLADVTGLIISPDLPRFGDLRHMDALRKFLTDDEIEVVIVDPAYLCIPTDGNEASLFAMGGLLRGMAETCSSVGAMMVLAHHTKKGVVDPFAPPELESIAWAGFQEFARQWLLVGRRESYEPGSGQHRLWLNVGGSAGHSGCYALDVAEGVYDGCTPRRWEVGVMLASEARQDSKARQEQAKADSQQAKTAAQLGDDRKAIVRAMVRKPPDTQKAIKERVAIRAERFGRAWASLLEDGTVNTAGEVTKGNNRSYPAYQLREESAP